MSRVKIGKALKPDYRKALTECIKRGALVGYNDVSKYTNRPTDEYIKERLAHAILEEIEEKFKLD